MLFTTFIYAESYIIKCPHALLIYYVQYVYVILSYSLSNIHSVPEMMPSFLHFAQPLPLFLCWQ